MKSTLVIGGGSIGKRHAKNLKILGCDVTVVEVNAERAATAEKELEVKIFSSFAAAIAADTFSMAFICSPSRFHLEQALICAEHGMDIFIEKPLSHSMDGVDKLVRLTQQKNLITMVGSNWKFYPLFIKMKELIDSGAIGRILSARCEFGSYLPDWHPWEDYRSGYSANASLGGGILLDSHEFDYLTWFMGKKVKKLACFASRVGDITVDTEDVAEVILQFEDGAIGEIHQDYIQRFPQRNFEFFGADGAIIWDNNLKKVFLMSPAKGWSPPDGRAGVSGGKAPITQEFPLPEPYDLNMMYLEEAKHFLECVQSRQETITSVKKGAQALKLICAAKESSKQGKAISF